MIDYIFPNDEKMINFCAKKCVGCTNCNGKKDGVKCENFPPLEVVKSVKEFNNVLINAGVEEKYLTKMPIYKKLRLAHAAKEGVKVSLLCGKGKASLSENITNEFLRIMECDVSDETINFLIKEKANVSVLFDIWLKLSNDKQLSIELKHELVIKEFNCKKVLSTTKKIAPLSKQQQNEIDKMKALGIDTKDYEKSTIKPGVLREIRLGYEHGVDVSVYYRRGHELRQMQCEQVRLGLESGLPIEIIDIYNKKEMVPEKMANIRMWYTDVPDELKDFIVEKLGENAKSSSIVRRISMVPICRDKKVLEKVLENWNSTVINNNNDFRFWDGYADRVKYPVFCEFEFIFRLLIILVSKTETEEDLEKCFDLFNEFNDFYRDTIIDYNTKVKVTEQLSQKDLTDDEKFEMRYSMINSFFKNKFNIELKDIIGLLDGYENIKEFNMYGDVFLEFKERYMNIKIKKFNGYC